MTARVAQAALLALATALAAPTFVGTAHAASACDPGTMIDASTANDAKRRFEAAGYRNVKVTKKGCDNFWHGTGVKDGAERRIVVSPSGEVMPEND